MHTTGDKKGHLDGGIATQPKAVLPGAPYSRCNIAPRVVSFRGQYLERQKNWRLSRVNYVISERCLFLFLILDLRVAVHRGVILTLLCSFFFPFPSLF